MEQTYEGVMELLRYYLSRADRLILPEEYEYAEELADKIWHLEETLEMIKQFDTTKEETV